MGNEVMNIKNYLKQDSVSSRINEVMKDRANLFMASIINACAGNASLMKCEPASIVGAAMVAAALDLPLDQNLGFAYMIPYDGKTGAKAQFQMGYKGFVQLAERSGQYADIHVSEVYGDEIKFHNPITGKTEFTDPSTWKQRDEGDIKAVVGYYAQFELLGGFKKSLYMSSKAIMNHAKHYSQTYRAFENGKISLDKSLYHKDTDAYGKKTVLKLLISKWGIMSVAMIKAVKADQAEVAEDGEVKYPDNPATAETQTSAETEDKLKGDD